MVDLCTQSVLLGLHLILQSLRVCLLAADVGFRSYCSMGFGRRCRPRCCIAVAGLRVVALQMDAPSRSSFQCHLCCCSSLALSVLCL